MRKLILPVLAVALTVAGALPAVPNKPAKKGKADKDVDKLKGTWTIVALEMNGQQILDQKQVLAGLKEFKIIITADKMISHQGNQVKSQSSYKIDSAKKPKQIDSTSLDGPQKGRTSLGIYEWQGDNLKIGHFMAGKTGSASKKRPTSFDSKDNPGLAVIVLKRVKP
jgi:uncharacterized protein (TIGR03067 family)